MPGKAKARDAETARDAALKRHAVLDGASEAAFERIIGIAAQLFDVPVALISFADDGRVWLKARHDLGMFDMPRAVGFFAMTMGHREATVILDATLDPRFEADPLVLAAPHIRFFAGAPLLTAGGQALGALCVIDTRPRATCTDGQRAALADLAALAMNELELRPEASRREVEKRHAALRERLLASNAEATTPLAAIDTAMRAVQEATKSPACLFFRTAPDGRQLQLLAGHGTEPLFDAAYLDGIRAAKLTMENSLSGLAMASGSQMLFNRFTPEFLERYRGIGLGAQRGLGALLVTPISLGPDLYSIAIGFPGEPGDIDDIKRLILEAAAALRPLLRRIRDAETAQLFQRAVDASADAVIISDAEPVTGAGPIIRYVNQAFLEQTGFRREEVIGRTPQILDGPETSDEARRAIRGALAQRLNIRQEIITYRRDGSSFWADLNIAPVADATGWFTHWVAVQRDVTAQKTEAMVLAEREAFFRYFFEQHPAPMWVYDRETLAFLDVNEAAVHAYGWSREEFLAMSILDIRPAEDRDAVRAKVASDTEQYSDTGPWRHLTAAGDQRLVQLRSRIIQMRGRLAGLVVVWDLTERIRAENDARDLARQLNATLESISDGFFTLNAHGRFTYANPQALAMLGHPGGSLLGRSLQEILPGAAGAEMLQRLSGILHGGTTERFAHHDAATQRWFDVTGYPAPGGLTIYLRDITARRLGEERLRLLEAAVDKLNDVILITEAEPIDLPGPRIVFVNAAFQRLTGFAPDEVISHSPRLLQGPGTSRRELDRIRAALEAWQPVRAELLNYAKDGTEIWIEIDIVPVGNAAGRWTHWVSVERDVTDRKRAQLRLEDQAAMLDQARDAILVRDFQHRVTFWNRSAERLYGWSSEEAQGRSVLDLIHGDPAPFLAAQVILLAQGHWSGTLHHRRKDGRPMIVEANWTLVRDAEGAPRAVLAVNSDVTEHMAVEEQLRQAQRMEAIGQLTGGIAHDFNNLLTVVLGNAEILTEALAGDGVLQPLAAVLLTAAERGAALTNRLLAFARRQTLAPKVIDANELLAGLQELIRRAIGEQMEVKLAATPGLWTAVIDPPQLEAAVLNLCINARDAMPQGGKITIETANAGLDADYAAQEREVAAGDYVMIAVSDTGTGMPPDVLAQAFEPFFTTKEVGRGSGLGLSMVYGFVKQSGGHVKIYSEVGHGTTVRIYIPRAPARAEASRPQAPPAEQVRGSERVLVVEDDPLVREHSARQLRRLGYAVELARDAAEALQALRGPAVFDLLFTDVVMPGGMTGHELAVEAVRLRPGLRVLLTSGYTENSAQDHGWLEAGHVLLQKPYRLSELASKLRHVLDETA